MKPIEKAQEAIAKKRSEGKITVKSPIEKSHSNPRSLRLAINGKCWDCCCGQRVEIKKCPITGCTLWPLRPYQNKEGSK